MKRIFILLLVLIAFFGVIWVSVGAQKDTADEVVAKTLLAIGSAQARDNMINLTAIGEVAYTQGSSKALPAIGQSALATEGEKTVLAMTFPSSVYQGEKFIFDGKSYKVAYSRPGVRSALGDFLWRYNGIIKDGLLGGVLSKNWVLNDPVRHNVRISLDGSKKIDGRDTYVLDCAPKKGSDVRIKLYFDKETFRHVRSEYFRTTSPLTGKDPNSSAGLSDNREELEEDFTDFKTENGITLPRTYKLRLRIERNGGSAEYFYTVTLKDLYYNSKLEPEIFGIEAK